MERATTPGKTGTGQPRASAGEPPAPTGALKRKRLSDTPADRLDPTGGLVRRSPGRSGLAVAAVGVNQALDLLLGCEAEERAVLDALVTRRYLSLMQIARAYYPDRGRAYRHLQVLYQARGVNRCIKISARVAGLLGDPKHPEPIYYLDWNGKMAALLRAGGGAEEPLAGWDAKTIATPGLVDAQQLAVNELWSLLLGAARTTHQPGVTSPSLTLGWSEDAPGVGEANPASPLVQPSADLVLGFRVPGPGDFSIPDWQRAELSEDEWPAATAIGGSEDQDPPAPISYRRVVLEFETGQHNRGALVKTISGYNTLQTQPALYQARYGHRFPQVLLVVPQAKDRREQMLVWRKHYAVSPELGRGGVPVVVASLEELRNHEAQPGGILAARIWWHILASAPADPQPLTFWEAFQGTGMPG